jgi:hypothetical protein
VSAAPARRSGRVEPAEGTAPPRRSRASARPVVDPARARSAERRRRERHFRRRRQDLLQDAGLALVITVVLIMETAGLGVLALLMIPLAGVMVGTNVAGRVRRRRARNTRPDAR